VIGINLQSLRQLLVVFCHSVMGRNCEHKGLHLGLVESDMVVFLDAGMLLDWLSCMCVTYY